MSESKYESKVCSIAADAHTVYSVLSRLDNLNRVKDLIPKDKVQELEVGEDYIRLKVDGLGQMITVRIVDTIEDDTIKFGFENLPVDMFFWIQLKQLTPSDTRIRLTLKADIPFMFKAMIGGKIQTGLDQAADMLSQFPYSLWAGTTQS